MRLPCWLVGHRRKSPSEFIRRLDGYPLAIYRSCERCDKRLDVTYGRASIPPPFDAGLAERWAQEFSREDWRL